MRKNQKYTGDFHFEVATLLRFKIGSNSTRKTHNCSTKTIVGEKPKKKLEALSLEEQVKFLKMEVELLKSYTASWKSEY